MSATSNPFSTVDYLGEPIVIQRGYQLCALLTICEQAAQERGELAKGRPKSVGDDNTFQATAADVGDGPYRDRVTSCLSNTLELAEEIAGDLLAALEQMEPRRMTGGERRSA